MDIDNANNFANIWNGDISDGSTGNSGSSSGNSSYSPSTTPPTELYQVINDLTDTQEVVMSVLAVLSGMLSILGSSTIVYKVIRNRKNAAPYDRIMLGLSCCDIVASLSWIFSPFFMPSETSVRVWASGTVATCTILGTLTQFGFCAVVYNGVLSMYYLLTVKFGVKRQWFAVKYEPYMHILPIFYFLVTSISGGVAGVYKEVDLGLGCWVNAFPAGCEFESNGNGGDTCISDEIGWAFGAGPTILTFLVLLINNVVIYRHVKRTLKSPTSSTRSRSQQQRQLDGCTTSTSNSNGRGGSLTRISSNRSIASTTSTSSTSRRLSSSQSAERSEQHNRHTREVATQGFLYVATFLIAYIPVFGLRVLEAYGPSPLSEAAIFPLFVLVSICLPLQGFFNMFVYNKPNFLRVRTAYPDKNLWWSLRKALLDSDIPRLSEASRMSSSTRALNNNNNKGGVSGMGRGSASRGVRKSSSGRYFSSDLDVLHEDSQEDDYDEDGEEQLMNESSNNNSNNSATSSHDEDSETGSAMAAKEMALLEAELEEASETVDNSTDDSSTLREEDMYHHHHHQQQQQQEGSNNSHSLLNDNVDTEDMPSTHTSGTTTTTTSRSSDPCSKPQSLPNLKLYDDSHRLSGNSTKMDHIMYHNTDDKNDDDEDYEEDIHIHDQQKPKSDPNFGAYDDYSSDEDFDLEAEYEKVFGPMVGGTRRIGFDARVEHHPQSS